MRLHRFYVKQPLGEELVVDQEEGSAMVHQWFSVFRYTSGDEVILFSSFDKQDYLYTIVTISKKEAKLRLLSKRQQKGTPREVTLYMALVKKDTFETIVRHATELGVAAIIPVDAARSEKKNLNLQRVESIAIEAVEQSGRGNIPHISPIVSFHDALAGANASTLHFFASLEEGISIRESVPAEHSAVWIGPEGGWTKEEELLASSSGFTKISLTETVLKADTAAISLLSFVLLP